VPARRKHTRWAALAWLLNIGGLGGILLVLGLYFSREPVQAATPPGIQPLLESGSATPYPTRSDLPTVTPNPRATRIVVDTPTPFVLANGLRPGLIGFSVAGRPIEVYTFGQGPHQRAIVAGIHGGYEWNTIALADELTTYVSAHPDFIPDEMTLYIVRNLNPDGDARAHGIDGRANDHGVDLNRNFPANWARDWDRDGCWTDTPVTGGSTPGSEPETRAMMSFLGTHKIEVLISYHSAALGIFPGGEPWEAVSVRFAQALDDATSYPFPPIDTGCRYTGTLADFAVTLGIAAVDMELTDHRNTDFNMNLKVLDLLLNWER